jgi:hypothetical protein
VAVSQAARELLTHCSHKPGRNRAAQQAPAVPRCVILSVGGADAPTSSQDLLAYHKVIRCKEANSSRYHVAARGAGASRLKVLTRKIGMNEF